MSLVQLGRRIQPSGGTNAAPAGAEILT